MPEVKSAPKRRAMNIAVNRENFRDRLNFSTTLNKITEIEEQLMSMCRPQTVFTESGDMKVVLISPDTAVSATLKIVLDSQWKRMAKVLPDLKPVDMHAALEQEIEEEEELPMMDMVEFKKRLRLKLLSDSINKRHDPEKAEDGEIVEEPPEWMK